MLVKLATQLLFGALLICKAVISLMTISGMSYTNNHSNRKKKKEGEEKTTTIN